jgi:hypothetical protein
MGKIQCGFLERYFSRQILTPILRNQDIIFEAYPNTLFGNINAWLTRDHHTCLEDLISFSGVMDIESEEVRSRVGIVLSRKHFEFFS